MNEDNNQAMDKIVVQLYGVNKTNNSIGNFMVLVIWKYFLVPNFINRQNDGWVDISQL